jgi:hypothetical protein
MKPSFNTDFALFDWPDLRLAWNDLIELMFHEACRPNLAEVTRQLSWLPDMAAMSACGR